jgi:hypothetical protein
MSEVIADLAKWLEEQKGDLVQTSIKLIREDAPKNRFSIVAGRMQMIDDAFEKLQQLVKDRSPNG